MFFFFIYVYLCVFADGLGIASWEVNPTPKFWNVLIIQFGF